MSGTPFNLDEYIMSHVMNGREWHIPFLPPIYLPQYLSKHGVMLIICALLLIFVFVFIYRKNEGAPRGFTNFLELMILFIRDQVVFPYLGEKDGRRMMPFFCTIFFFILGLNLLGMVPIFVAATGNVNVTGALATTTLFFMIFGAIQKNGIHGFFKALTPSGVPLPLLIVLVRLSF